jgi:hypothetical protein
MKNRAERGAAIVRKRAKHLPSISSALLRLTSRSWKQLRRQARQARYHAAVIVRGSVQRDHDRQA